MENSLAYILLCLFFGCTALYHYCVETGEIRTRLNLLCIVVFFLFFGFRGFVGDDWQSYYVSFQTASWSELSLVPNNHWNYEVGFSVLMFACKSIINDYQFFVLICSLVNTLLLSRFLLKRMSNVPLGLMLYICMGGLVMSTNLMRNSIAILIFVNALEYIEQRRPLPYLVMGVLAISFHTSATIYLPLYFFLHRNISKWVYLGVFLVGNAILLLHISLLLPLTELVGRLLNAQMLEKINDYTEMQDTAGFVLSIGYLERLFTGLLVFVYVDRLKMMRQENVVFINALLLYFVMIFMFSEFEEFSKRMSNLFIFAYWILWYDLIKTFSVMNNRRLFIGFIGIYCMMKLVGTASYVSWRYDSTLLGAKSYQERLFIYNRNIPDSK